MHLLERAAVRLANSLGRDWSDCGPYERMTFCDAIERKWRKLARPYNVLKPYKRIRA